MSEKPDMGPVETMSFEEAMAALEQVVGLRCTGAGTGAGADAQLMRWGAAFPLAAGSGGW